MSRKTCRLTRDCSDHEEETSRRIRTPVDDSRVGRVESREGNVEIVELSLGGPKSTPPPPLYLATNCCQSKAFVVAQPSNAKGRTVPHKTRFQLKTLSPLRYLSVRIPGPSTAVMAEETNFHEGCPRRSLRSMILLVTQDWITFYQITRECEFDPAE